MPDRKAPPSERASAHQAIHEWAQSNREWLFFPNALSWCHVHNKLCPAFKSTYHGCQPGDLEGFAPLKINAAG
eukprot:14476404-Alexandrium_andersonii.AAC.1